MAVVPRHIAIIMDGNGRWAARRGLPRAMGHRKGIEAAKRIVEAASEFGVQYLTLYGFSSENWRRPVEEVNDLMGLLRTYLRSDLADMHRNNIRLRIIGERIGLDKDLVAMIDEAETLTAKNGKLTVVIAFNYGGRNEIVRVTQCLARDVALGRIVPDDITAREIEDRLDTRDIPDPDLLIRTSGEQRISNFLLWQAAYAELVFPDVLWPDFSKRDLEHAIEIYGRRERRFGARLAEEGR
jgi:undecaprenyl diphosphate synthase